MTTVRKPKCFVAMAFDHGDTDELYEKSIQPMLKANKVTPVIINRREDNRDINQQIIEQLDECDFCITDLTYARPSVYFEAGYAQRAVSVIYTVRTDHLKNVEDNLRVHFDLQMKPIIDWKTPDDTRFRTRLEKRLKATVLREWIVKQAAQEKVDRYHEQFSHISLNARLLLLQKIGVRKLYELGYNNWYSMEWHRRAEWWEITAVRVGYKSILAKATPNQWFVSMIDRDSILHIVNFFVTESITLTILRDSLSRWFTKYANDPPYLGQDFMLNKQIHETAEHHIMCSINKLPRARVMSAIPTLDWDTSALCYSMTTDVRLWHEPNPVTRHANVHFLDGIKSLPEFEARFVGIGEKIVNTEH